MSQEIPDHENLSRSQLFSVRRDGLSFLQCAEECLKTPELLAQIDRLYGTNLQLKGTPIELMIDKATGRQAADLQTFLRFVWNCIFIRVPIQP